MIKAIKLQKQPSRYGGYFYYVFFKDLQTGKSYRTCLYPTYGNFERWRKVIYLLEKNQEVILEGAITRGNLVDADSLIRIKEAQNEKTNQYL